MSRRPHCEDCGNPVPRAAGVCPHCGRPSRYPNVQDADDAREVAELTRRYDEAAAHASARGVSAALADFERALGGSRAVIARPLEEVQRLAKSDDEIYATFYQLITGGVKSYPEDDEWARRRVHADSSLFENYKEHIRFAALTLGEAGLSSYGGCSMLLRTDMVAHRSSVFEENSTLFVERHLEDLFDLPRGHRASWANRAMLCVAKLHREIDGGVPPDKYSEVLLKQGATTGDADFVEVHVYGPMTARTFEQVTVTATRRSLPRSIKKALEANLRKLSVTLKEK